MATRKKNKKQADEVLVDIVEVRDSAQGFFEKNQKVLTGVAIGLVVLVGGFFVYNNLYLQPRQIEASDALYRAQQMFEQDSFTKALTDPGGGYLGMLDIAEQYSSTKAGNLANYYSGVAYLNLGRYQVAIEYLKDFKAKGDIMPIMKNGALGDVYSELQDFNTALSYYRKAADSNNNLLTPYYLKKVGLLQERQGDKAAAKAAYERIKTEFTTSPEGREIDKFIARVE